MNPPIQVCIIGNSQATPHQMEVAEAAGRILATHGHTVVTGGRTGVMEAAAKGAREAGGIAVGILPTEDTSSSNSYNNVVIPTGMGYTRNALNILAAQAVICVGGMVGTMNEMGFAWMWQRPMWGIQGTGGWTDKVIGTCFDERWDRPIPGIDLEELEDLAGRWAAGEPIV